MNTEEKNKRIKEIDERIVLLKDHMVMWGRAGGMGGRMAMQANQEIKELEIEKSDLINGTNNLAILKKEKEIKRLKALKEEAMFLKRIKYSKEISKQEEELEMLQKSNQIKK